MKTKVLQLFMLGMILTAAVGCSSSRNTSSSRTPSGTRTSKSERAADSFPGVIFGGTRTANPTNLPPGQAKKINGDQSAKAYAPGQQKKMANGNGNNRKGNKGGKKKKGKKN